VCRVEHSFSKGKSPSAKSPAFPKISTSNNRPNRQIQRNHQTLSARKQIERRPSIRCAFPFPFAITGNAGQVVKQKTNYRWCDLS
jgi:hypothetical protein